jgi:BirA family transcriptional regulator, biotin operon repressor / biotin---[acetyl-CoA-carboxylase] ligase
VRDDSLAPEHVLPLLRGRFGTPYRYCVTTASTQRLLGANDPEGAVAVAEEQTEGRGRRGRRWLAPRGSSVLVSLQLRPAGDLAAWPEFSPLAGEACAEAIRAVAGLEPTVKLPNDVLLGGRKVAGVLAEAKDGRLVLGIGINVNVAQADLPTTAPVEATSLLLELGKPLSRPPLLAALLLDLERYYDAWPAASA